MTPLLIVFGFILFILAIVVMNFGATWVRAWASGARVTFMELIALQIRSIPVKPIVETRIVLIKSGFNVSVDDLSTHHLAGGDVHMVMQGLLKAKEKNIDLSFDHACALDFLLKGHKETVELLIAEGVDVKDADGVTPPDFAKRHPEIADLLRRVQDDSFAFSD